MNKRLFTTMILAGFLSLTGFARADSGLVLKIRAALASNPRATVDALNNSEMVTLLAQREYAAVEEFAITGTLAVASDPARIEQLQRHRIAALLAEGQSQEALAAAKGLFNVCTMHFVKDALPLLCDALKAAYPNDPSYVPRLKLQILANAQETPAERKRLADKYGGNAIMNGLKGDPEPYVHAIAKLQEKTDYKSLCETANLELLSGRIGDAADRLNRAYAIAPPDDLNAASEGIARRIKAEDGAIGARTSS